jgi:hypothetical protein
MTERLGFGAVRFSSSLVADASSALNRSVRFSALEDGPGGGDQEDLEEGSTRRIRRRRGRKSCPPTEPEHAYLTSLESLRPAARTTEDLPDDLVRECFSLCGSLQQALHADVLQVSPREEQAMFTSTSTIGLMLNGTEIDNLVRYVCIRCNFITCAWHAYTFIHRTYMHTYALVSFRKFACVLTLTIYTYSCMDGWSSWACVLGLACLGLINVCGRLSAGLPTTHERWTRAM